MTWNTTREDGVIVDILGCTTGRVPATSGAVDLADVWALSPRFDLVSAVGRHVGRALARLSRPAVVACTDNWSARIALDAAALSASPACVSVPEPTDELVARAERRDVALVHDGAGDVRAPAVVIAPRLGATAGDVESRVESLCTRCADDGTVVWSHCLRTPGVVAATRSALDAAGFSEVASETVGAQPRIPGWFVASTALGLRTVVGTT